MITLVLIVVIALIITITVTSFIVHSGNSKHVNVLITPKEIATGGKKTVVIKHGKTSHTQYLTIPEELSELEDTLCSKKASSAGSFNGRLYIRWRVADGTSRYRRIIVDKDVAEKGGCVKLKVNNAEHKLTIPRSSKSGDILQIDSLTKSIVNKKMVTIVSKFYAVLEIDAGIDQFKEQWITKNDLGKKVLLSWNNKNYEVSIPKVSKQEFTMRLSGLGTVKYKRRGDLLVKFKVDYGIKEIWVSEREATQGTDKKIKLGSINRGLVIPPNSRDRDIIRIPNTNRIGSSVSDDLVIIINVYPDNLTPPEFSNRSCIDTFIQEQIAFLRNIFDFEKPPPAISQVIDVFEMEGLQGIFRLFRNYLNLNELNMQIFTKENLGVPGTCMGMHNNLQNSYIITVDSKYVSQPFPLAYIIGHELSHAYLCEKLENVTAIDLKLYLGKCFSRKDKEKQADIFTVMTGMGLYWELSRRKGLLLGYFSQFEFEKMWGIINELFGVWKATESGMIFWRSSSV